MRTRNRRSAAAISGKADAHANREAGLHPSLETVAFVYVGLSIAAAVVVAPPAGEPRPEVGVTAIRGKHNERRE